MLNIRFVLEYDGTAFHGWQFQPGLRNIQGELQRVIPIVLRKPISPIYVSGRTDSGVHARGQVCNFFVDLPPEEAPELRRFAYSVSSILRREVAVVHADYVAPEFNSRTSADCKQYSYHLVVRDAPAVLDYRRAWSLGPRLDLERFSQEAQHVVGEHDFTSFRASDCVAVSPIREVLESEVIVQYPYVTYRVVGRGFLKQMVRNIVGTLTDLAMGRHPAKSLKDILQAKDRQAAGMLAPAYGLYLDWVHYPAPFTLPSPFGAPRRSA